MIYDDLPIEPVSSVLELDERTIRVGVRLLGVWLRAAPGGGLIPECRPGVGHASSEA